jgi:HAD superfamily hydrolase (TIGR01509 family)
MPGTLATYRALGLPVAVVSNSAFHRLHRSVERAGMLALAGGHVYSAEDVGRPKPAPDGYLHAARALGHEPAHCLVIEDSPTGVRAARAAGMRVLGFLGGSHIGDSHAPQLLAAGADALFDDMAELPALIARLEGRA